MEDWWTRPARNTHVHDFRFHLVDPAGGNLDAVAGFQSVTVPEITLEVPTYREGTMAWTQKYPGIQTVGQVQCTKGVFKRDSDFLKWLFKCIEGGKEYRSDIIIQEFHITDEFGINGTPSRVIRLREVFPSAHKPSSDKSGESSAVSMQSLTLEAEQINVELVPT